MTPEQIRYKLKNQSPDDAANMKQAVDVSPLRLGYFQSGENSELSADELKRLAHWFMGDYGMDSVSKGWVLRPMASPAPQASAALPMRAKPGPAVILDPKTGFPLPTLGCKTVRPALAAKDLPATTDEARARIRAADEVEAAKRKKPNVATQMLTGIRTVITGA